MIMLTNGFGRFDALILGGGLAGLSAALAFSATDIDFCVLEAQDHCGGRIKTIIDRNTGDVIELGGCSIGDSHKSLLSLAAWLGVGVETHKGVSKHLIPDDVCIRNSKLPKSQISLLRRELNFLKDELIRMAEKISPSANTSSAYLKKLDLITVEQWLVDKEVSQNLRILFSDLAPRAQSMAALLCLIRGGKGVKFFEQNEIWHIPLGTSELTNRISTQLHKKILTGFVVKSAFKEGNLWNVIGTLNGNYINLQTASIVFSLPPPVWPENVRSFLPLHTLPILSRNFRASFVYAQPESMVSHKQVISDIIYRVAEAEHIGSRLRRLDILVCPHLHQLKGDYFRNLASHFKKFGLKQFNHPQEYHFKWSQSKWSRGSYATFPPGTMAWANELHAKRPSGFAVAGDWVLPEFTGYMEGATRSGVFAACEIVKLLGAKFWLNRLPFSWRNLIMKNKSQPKYRYD